MAKRTEPESPASFEDSLARLSEIVGLLERGEAPLEEGLRLFEEGVSLTRRCHELLNTAEQRIQELVRTEDGFELTSHAIDDPDREEDED
ncbi:MAG: exodeoxyribonuclease VII small subunit [bacterium]